MLMSLKNNGRGAQMLKYNETEAGFKMQQSRAAQNAKTWTNIKAVPKPPEASIKIPEPVKSELAIKQEPVAKKPKLTPVAATAPITVPNDPELSAVSQFALSA